MDNMEDMDSIVCRYFVSPSGCKLGRLCPFPHIIDRNRKPDTICRFFLENKCVFGNRCWHLHKNIPLQNVNSFAEINFENNQSSSLDFNYTENEVCINQKGNDILYNVHPAVFSEWFSNNNADSLNNFIYSYSCVNNSSFSEDASLYPGSSDLYAGTFNYYYENSPTWYYDYAYNGTPQPYLNSNLQHESILYSSPVSDEITEGQENQETRDFSICTNNSSRPDYYASSGIYTTSPSVIEYEFSTENHGSKNSLNQSESNPTGNYEKDIISCSSKEEENFPFEIHFAPDVPLSDYSNRTWSSGINKEHEDIPKMLQINENMTKCLKPYIEASFSNKLLNINGSCGDGFDKEHQEIPDMDSIQMNENMTECLSNSPEICLLNNLQNTNGNWSNNINEEHEEIPETNQTQMNKNKAEFSNNYLEMYRANYFLNGSWNHSTNNQHEEISEIVPGQLNRGKNEILNNYSLEVSFSNYFQNINGSANNHSNNVLEKGPLMHFVQENENETVLSNNPFMYSSQHCFQSNYESSFSFSKIQPKFTSTDFKSSVTNFNSKNNFQKSKRLKLFQSNTLLRHSNYKQIKKYDVSNRKHRQSKMCRNFAANSNTKHFRGKFYQNNDKHSSQYSGIDSRRKWKDLKEFTEGTILKMSNNCNLPRQRPPCFSYSGKTENIGLLSQNFSESCVVNENIFTGEENNLGLNNLKCLMCLQNIGNPCAILENCDHRFCLKCIYWWRGVQNIRKNFANCAASCPVCKIISTCIVPTRCWVESGPAKENVIKRYKNLLKQIHCKYFNRGKGFCVYGNSCIYLHEYGKKLRGNGFC